LLLQRVAGDGRDAAPQFVVGRLAIYFLKASPRSLGAALRDRPQPPDDSNQGKTHPGARIARLSLLHAPCSPAPYKPRIGLDPEFALS